MHDITEFVMLFLFHSTQYFQRALTQINTDRNQLDRELNNEIANRDLRELAQIAKRRPKRVLYKIHHIKIARIMAIQAGAEVFLKKIGPTMGMLLKPYIFLYKFSLYQKIFELFINRIAFILRRPKSW